MVAASPGTAGPGPGLLPSARRNSGCRTGTGTDLSESRLSAGVLGGASPGLTICKGRDRPRCLPQQPATASCATRLPGLDEPFHPPSMCLTHTCGGVRPHPREGQRGGLACVNQSRQPCVTSGALWGTSWGPLARDRIQRRKRRKRPPPQRLRGPAPRGHFTQPNMAAAVSAPMSLVRAVGAEWEPSNQGSEVCWALSSRK